MIQGEDAAEEGGLGARGGGLGVEAELAGGEAAGVDGVGRGALVGGVGSEVHGGVGAVLPREAVEVLEDRGLDGVEMVAAKLRPFGFEVVYQLRAQILQQGEME